MGPVIVIKLRLMDMEKFVYSKFDVEKIDLVMDIMEVYGRSR